MEYYYEALIQELEENQRHMLGELQNLINEHSSCLYTVSSAKAHFDILTWWKLNGHRYSILSQIDKDVLAISVSTVASKSALRVLDPFRSYLTYKTVESLICTQNWLHSTLLGERIIQPTHEETEFYEVIEAGNTLLLYFDMLFWLFHS